MMEGMADKLSPVLSSPSIDPKIKERLLSLVVEKLEDISRYSKEGLQSWASDLREVMTANTLPDPRTDMSFYHKKFIGLRIQNLGDITSGLMVAYGPRTTVGKFSYNGLDYTALRDGIRGIDGKLGLNI